jgi:hypothetical protein
MMAGLGYKSFAPGEVLTAANLQGYAVDQSVMKFATTAARTSALAALSQGMMSWIDATGSLEVYMELYNASTNPGGAVTAGWYPVPGASMFYGIATRSAATGTVYSVGASGFTYTEYIDPYGWHSAVTNTERVTPTIAGLYRITVNVQHAANASGSRRVQIFKNTTQVTGQTGSAVSPGSAATSSTAVIAMNGSTDYFYATTFQDSGSSLTGRCADRGGVLEAAAGLMRYYDSLGEAGYPVADGLTYEQDWQEHLNRGSLGGVDFAVPTGSPVIAPTRGIVENLTNASAGNYVNFHHLDDAGNRTGFYDQFMHLSRFVSAGTYELGATIGFSGNTGSSTGPHIHWDLVDPQGTRVRPWLYFTPQIRNDGQMYLVQKSSTALRFHHCTRIFAPRFERC